MKIGEFLKSYRELKGYTLKDVARQTNVSLKYLEALESDDFSVFPSILYAKGYLKIFCEFLGIKDKELETLLKRYQKEFKIHRGEDI